MKVLLVFLVLVAVAVAASLETRGTKILALDDPGLDATRIARQAQNRPQYQDANGRVMPIPEPVITLLNGGSIDDRVLAELLRSSG